ncbi:MAG TPA: DinB family protein [Saprospiraceae bacterium]|nr:DinB family protein [Saprospiraceae bacterium]
MEFTNAIQSLHQYHQYANDQILKVIFPETGEIENHAYLMMSHILLAENVWYCRILNVDFNRSFDSRYSEEECRQIMEENSQLLSRVLGEKSMDEMIEYKSRKGEAFQNSVAEILLQVSHHYNHHRGQIARCIRLAGKTPPPTDYIFYARKNV